MSKKKTIPFTKMAGAGNDFMLMENRAGVNYKKLAVQACDRSTGVGADGIIVLDKSRTSDYRMRIFNADGSEAEMCGNGVRCLAAYIVKNRKPRKKLFSIETLAGEILGEATGEIANVRLSSPKDYRADISINVNGRKMNVSYIDTGVPHVIIFVADLDKIDVSEVGRLIRYHDAFKPRGANANFVEVVDDGLVNVRTYERGVEDETKACGTGSVASAIVSYLKANPDVQNRKKARMKVRTTGGDILQVTFDIVNRVPENVWLKGSARFVAKGEYYV